MDEPKKIELTAEQVRQLLAEGRELRRVLEERIRSMRTPTAGHLLSRAR